MAVIDESAALFAEDYDKGRFPGHFPDFMALYLVTQVLHRMRGEAVFQEVLPGLANRASFRHDMLRLGLADHLRLHTPYPVSLPTRSSTGQRTVDLVIDVGAGLEVETKSSDEFDGPQKRVSGTNAWRGIRRAWRSAYGGEKPQLVDDRPSAILVGGVTVEHSSMPTILQAARHWLGRKGGDHPNCWGILVMTYLILSRMPAGRRIGNGAPLTVTGLASPYLIGAPSPHYTGPVQLVFTPPAWESR